MLLALHPWSWRAWYGDELRDLLGAGSMSVAVIANLTANILWPPSTPPRAAAVGALVACWLPVLRRVGESARRRLRPASHQHPVR